MYSKKEPEGSLHSRVKNALEVLYSENIEKEYTALMQNPRLLQEPEYINEKTREKYCLDNNLRLLREYQIKAVKALQRAVKDGRGRFLFEMAAGTGKTLVSAAVIKLFLVSGCAKRVLFLADRIELERQAKKNFEEYLKDYISVIYKNSRTSWQKSDIVITTIQSLLVLNRYKKEFSPDDFDLLIADEAHRSIGGNARSVLEYFNGYKLGLTATPKDYIKNIDVKKLAEKDPKALERRLLLDTYETFGCKSSEPVFKYSHSDAVKDGFLADVSSIDARTDITTELLSEEGCSVIQTDASGAEFEEKMFSRQFERKFFSENTNIQFCKILLENGLKDPMSGEFGKTIIFCVSRNHCAKIVKILNEAANQIWPGMYNSDFAKQVTSDIHGAQEMAEQFANNNLSGNSKFLDDYKTSRTRICATVGMMTTGYDCCDILNIALMRPVFSPSDFIQMKGRGTRLYTFKYPASKPKLFENKEYFKLFDFFANCEYFEKNFNYDAKLKLPKTASEHSKAGNKEKAGAVEIFAPDKLKELRETKTGIEINSNAEFIKQAVIKTQDEILEDECNVYIKVHEPDKECIPYIKNFIKAYVTSMEFRNIIDAKKYQELNFYAGFTMEDYENLGRYRKTLPEYIKKNILLQTGEKNVNSRY